MNRKDFLKNASAATVLAYFGLSLESCSIDNADVAPPGGLQESVKFNLNEAAYVPLEDHGGWVLHPTENILIINVDGDLRAFGSRCTHTGCTRDWTFPNNVFHCGCHGSEFNIECEVVQGPASSPLSRLTLVQSGDDVTIG